MNVLESDYAVEQQINQFLATHSMVLKAIEVHDDSIHRNQCLAAAAETAERHGVQSLTVSFKRSGRDKQPLHYDLISQRPKKNITGAGSE